eukprot:SAG31_NODE_23537_length_502_cov_0.863524_1_plen_166_part_11
MALDLVTTVDIHHDGRLALSQVTLHSLVNINMHVGAWLSLELLSLPLLALHAALSVVMTHGGIDSTVGTRTALHFREVWMAGFPSSLPLNGSVTVGTNYYGYDPDPNRYDYNTFSYLDPPTVQEAAISDGSVEIKPLGLFDGFPVDSFGLLTTAGPCQVSEDLRCV